LRDAGQAIKLAQDFRGIDINAAEFKIADLTLALSDIKLALAKAREN
jgi:hypothetical protein